MKSAASTYVLQTVFLLTSPLEEEGRILLFKMRRLASVLLLCVAFFSCRCESTGVRSSGYRKEILSAGSGLDHDYWLAQRTIAFAAEESQGTKINFCASYCTKNSGTVHTSSPTSKTLASRIKK